MTNRNSNGEIIVYPSEEFSKLEGETVWLT